MLWRYVPVGYYEKDMRGEEGARAVEKPQLEVDISCSTQMRIVFQRWSE